MHGETGGWHPDDHAEFVNLLKACGGDYTHAVKLTLENCIGYSQRDVILHSRCVRRVGQNRISPFQIPYIRIYRMYIGIYRIKPYSVYTEKSVPFRFKS